jgi:menaquinone-9 beta-reductase
LLIDPIATQNSGQPGCRPSAVPDETDVLIAGGGPAGLAAAIALRQRGIGCVVAEALSPGIDKACGEGLMPGTQESLARLGVRVDVTDGHSFRGIRFANADHCVDAQFPHGTGIGVRRPRLHGLLSARAKEMGATLLWNSRVQLPESKDGRVAMVDGAPLRFRWLVGADGQSSSVRRWAGLDATRRHSQRYGFRTHYRVAPWSDFVEIHWGRSGQLYVTPVAQDCVCVVFLTGDYRCDRGNVLEEFPTVARRLDGAGIVSQQRGAVSATSKLRRVADGSVALIGDASGSADSITGEGLAMSFHQALALAESIEAGSLAPYRRAHGRIGRLPHAMGALMLTLDRWPAFEAAAMRALASDPGLFRELLSAHVGETGLAQVLLRRTPRFGWNLLKGAAFA